MSLILYHCEVLVLATIQRVRGDFLVETARDDDNICFPVDPSWKNASVRYANVLRYENDNVVTVLLEEALTVMETKPVLMSVAKYNEIILEIAEEFEDSIKGAMQSNELNEDEDEERSKTDTESATLENGVQEKLHLSRS